MEHHKVILGGNGLRKRFFARNEMVRSEGRRRKIFSKREDSKNGGEGEGTFPRNWEKQRPTSYAW